MGEMADYYFEQGFDAIASGDACEECGYPLYDAPGCQCDQAPTSATFTWESLGEPYLLIRKKAKPLAHIRAAIRLAKENSWRVVVKMNARRVTVTGKSNLQEALGEWGLAEQEPEPVINW